jgi:hypothetical protein
MDRRRLPLWVFIALGALALLIVAVGVIFRPMKWSMVPEVDPAEQARDAERYAAIPADVDFVGVKLTARANQVSTDEPLTFDSTTFDTADFWDGDELAMPRDGFYRVTVQVTILGGGYEGSEWAPDATLTVTRNHDPHDFVCGHRHSDEDPDAALLLDCGATDWFLEGDTLQVLVTPGRTVESNWPGRANVSPAVTVELLGS